MEDREFSGDIRDMETFKVDDSTAVATSSGYEQIEGRSCQAQLATGSEKEDIFDRNSCLRFKGMITSSLQSNVVPGMASAGASRAVADSNAKKDSGRPFPIRPQLASALHARNISCIRPDFSDMIVEQRHDPRILFGKQGERYRQEVRQQKIQQWVLKHNFSQDSLPSDCWPDKYPQTIQGTEHESIESLEKPDSGKQAEEPLQQSSGTRSLYSDPRKTTFANLSTHEPYRVSMATTTADSGIFHASKGALMKKRKIDYLKEGTDKSAMALCKKPALAPVLKGSYPSDGDVGSNITLRQWLNRPSRIVDHFECLHIFKQILEFVHLAHAQGIVLRNVRPSLFILSSMHRVSFLDSASSRSTSGSSDASIGGASGQASLLDTATLSNDIATSSEGRALSSRQAVAPFTREMQSFEDHHNGFRSTSNNRQNMGSSKRLNVFSEKAWDKLEVESWLSSPSSQKSSSFGMEPLDDDLKVAADSQKDISISKAFMVAKKSNMQERLTLGSLSGDDVQQGEHFPVWPTRLIEEIWYASPEEVLDGTFSFASDIYCLGVLLFELFCSSSTWEEYSRVMLDLRHRILPSRMLSDRPKEASFCLWLLHPNPNSRPEASELLHSEILNEAGEALVERQAAMNIEESEAETELLLDFLQHVQQQKQELASRLLKDLSCLTSDIQEVERRRSLLKHTGMQSSGVENQVMCSKLTEHRGSCNIKDSLLKDRGFIDGEASEMSVHGLAAEVSRKGMQVGSESVQRQEDLHSKCARLMRNFDQLEQVYFSMRWKVQPSQTCRSTSNFGSQNQDTASASTATNVPFSGSGTQKSSEVVGTSTQESDSLGCFFDSLCKYARFNKFEVRATLRHGDLLNTANMVCSLSFDRDQEYFATAGVCKRIKVFECDAVLNESIDIHYPVIEMTNRSMLSSICWNSYIKSHIASSDYDGVVQLWDASTGQSLMLYEEHEKRAWSVDFSQADPTKLASGSDDKCVKIWTINQEGSIGTIRTNANVCCIQFPRESSHLIAFGSADYKIYCYDLRSTRVPWCILASHKKAVSYVKFLNANTLVSASTDNTLKLWDLSQTSSAGGISRTCLQSYMGHTNEKNFVGLAVMDGYIACGSESNSVFAYHKSLPMPMAFHKFGSVDPISGQESEDDTGQFVSSVCWRGKSQILVAANSMGNIKVLEMV